MRIGNILEAKCKTCEEKTAIVFRGEKTTFKDLKAKVYRLAHFLAADPDFKIGKDDKVAVCLPSCPEYVYSYLGIWCTGGVAVPLDFALTPDEMIACLQHCDAKVLITQDRPGIDLKNLKKQCRSLRWIILVGPRQRGYHSFDECLARSQDRCPPQDMQDRDYAVIFYTSGTTGKVKGVLINYLQLGVPPQSMEYFVNLTDHDLAVCALPFSHLGGMIYILNCVCYSMTIILMERFAPHEFLSNVQTYKATCFWIVPSMYYALLNVKDLEKFDLKSLRWIVTFGASNSPEALRRFHQVCPQARLLNGWGLTETNAPTTVLPMDSDNIESVGKAPPWVHLKIFNDNDKEMPPGEAGEVVVKGWFVTDGYYKDAETTAAAFRHGWFHTGDLGKFDKDGFLYIMGRKKEIIKVAGELVFEPEVEAVIHQHEGVAEVAVIGVPDKMRGEVPKALIVLKEGCQNIDDVSMRHFCKEHLAHFKIPHYFEFVPYLPKNRTGKIDKARLREEESRQTPPAAP